MGPLEALMERNRRSEFKMICEYIKVADIETLARLIEEIRCVHDNLLAFNPNINLLFKVESVCLKGECIQLNLDDEQKNKRSE